MTALRSPTRIRLLLAVLVLAAALLVVTAPAFILAMAPAIALFLMVANRVMPGADAIVRLRSAYAARRARPAAQRPYEVVLVRRTGRLIAAALAMRPPPARLQLTS
jgi:hypothetical protein